MAIPKAIQRSRGIISNKAAMATNRAGGYAGVQGAGFTMSPSNRYGVPAVRPSGPAIGANSAFNKIGSTLKSDWNAAQSAYKTFSGARAQGTGFRTAARGAAKHLMNGMGPGGAKRLAGYGAGVAGVGALGVWGLSGD